MSYNKKEDDLKVTMVMTTMVVMMMTVMTTMMEMMMTLT
jgi:hypothetical protein